VLEFMEARPDAAQPAQQAAADEVPKLISETAPVPPLPQPADRAKRRRERRQRRREARERARANAS